MAQIRRSLRDKALLKRRRIIGGSLWSNIWGGIKKFVGSDTGKKLIKTGISTVADAAPGLLGRAWNWIKGKITGKKENDKLPEEVTTLAKKVGNEAEKKVIGFIERKLAPKQAEVPKPVPIPVDNTSDEPSLSDYSAIQPEGYGMRRRKGKGMAPLGAGMTPLGAGLAPLGAGRGRGLTSESMKLLQNLAKKGSGVKLTR
jgi:hypothetical protein